MNELPDTVDALILDLLEWIGPLPLPYAEVLEAWRTLRMPDRGQEADECAP